MQAAIARLKAETASKGGSMGRTQSLPSQANPGLERSTSSNTGLSGFSCSTLLHVSLSQPLLAAVHANVQNWCSTHYDWQACIPVHNACVPFIMTGSCAR